MAPTNSNDTDIDIDMDESSSGAVSDALTNPLPSPTTKKVTSGRATLWLVMFAVLVIGASIAGGYMLAMRQVNAGAQVSDAGGASIATDDSVPKDTIISEPLESEEAEISPEPESSEQDSLAAKNTGIDVLVDSVGARVSLDGHYLGQAPLRVRNILPGRHQISVASADDSKVAERTVELLLGEAKVVSMVLGLSKEEVEVAKDERSDRGREQESKKGRARRKASEAQDKPKAENQTSSSTANAEKVSLGTLMLGSKPPCAISIDGKATGKSTPQRAIQLPEGLHRVVLTNAEQGIRKSFKVRIKAGRTTRAIQDLRPKL